MDVVALLQEATRERDAWRKLAKARADLLTCYRIGAGPGDRKADSALTKIYAAQDELRALGVEEG